MDNDTSPERITTCSWSRLGTYEKCPAWAQRKYIYKQPELPNAKRDAALTRGTQWHLWAEQFVKGEIPDLPTELQKYPIIADRLEDARALYSTGGVVIEEDWGFTTDWTVTGWHAPDVWLRMKLDRLLWLDPQEYTAAEVTDYKTGRKDGNEVYHSQQGQLYVVATFMRYPTVQTVRVSFEYFDHGKITKKDYTRAQALEVLPRMDARLKAMTEATEFPVKPNRINCRFCPYGPNGGDRSCVHGVEV